MKHLLPLLILCTAAGVRAQEATPPPAPARTANDVWVLRLSNPTREYAVRLGALQTVTLQDYDVRKAGQIQRVVELTIGTAGGNMARFFWEDKPEDAVKVPQDLEQKRREVEKAMAELTGAKTAEPKTQRVQKDYPATTHTPWAEFKLSSEGDVRDLHARLMETWAGRTRE